MISLEASIPTVISPDHQAQRETGLARLAEAVNLFASNHFGCAVEDQATVHERKCSLIGPSRKILSVRQLTLFFFEWPGYEMLSKKQGGRLDGYNAILRYA